VRLAAETIAPLGDQDVADIAASFQSAVSDVVARKTTQALARMRGVSAPPVLVVAGGVAANKAIGTALRRVTDDAGATLVVPPPKLCTDNGAMVAWAGAERLALGDTDALDAVARARWPLDEADMRIVHGA
jgi:N6-L-threonylcarbamoyladenine synthase